MTKAGKRLLSAAKEMTEMADWKARAEAAEARVKELESRKRSLTEDVMTLGAMVYDENAVKWRERALVAERRIVNDDMVKMAMQRILKDWKAEDVFVRPELEAAEIASIAATAALASVDAAPVPRLTVTNEMVETAMKRILKDWKAAGITVKPDLEASEIASRAALTAALENRHD